MNEDKFLPVIITKWHVLCGFSQCEVVCSCTICGQPVPGIEHEVETVLQHRHHRVRGTHARTRKGKRFRCLLPRQSRCGLNGTQSRCGPHGPFLNRAVSVRAVAVLLLLPESSALPLQQAVPLQMPRWRLRISLPQHWRHHRGLIRPFPHFVRSFQRDLSCR
jgi:hypothetical protein